MLQGLQLPVPYYLVADAYYASQKIVLPLLESENHLVTRVRNNAVAYEHPSQPKTKKRGRPRQYGCKIALKDLFLEIDNMTEVDSPVYGEKDVKIKLMHKDLIWKSAKRTVRFVIVIHPTRGQCILMTTDLSLSAEQVVYIYGCRFKIEVAFKQLLHTVGAFSYHFWMSEMKPLKRYPKNQYMHRESKKYREAVRRKIKAYHRHIQTGLIAQGLMQVVSLTATQKVWKSFGSWLRTVRPNVLPSEFVTAIALRNAFPDFLSTKGKKVNLTKFLIERMNFSRHTSKRLVG